MRLFYRLSYVVAITKSKQMTLKKMSVCFLYIDINKISIRYWYLYTGHFGNRQNQRKEESEIECSSATQGFATFFGHRLYTWSTHTSVISLLLLSIIYTTNSGSWSRGDGLFLHKYVGIMSYFRPLPLIILFIV